MVVLLFAFPTISHFVKAPSGQGFSEIYILGSNHTFENIPFDVKANVTYSVYLGVVNHLGSASFYTCFVKIANETESLPNQTLETPSTLPPLYEFNTLLGDGGTWEVPLTFQVNELTFNGGTSLLNSVTINGVDFPVNQPSLGIQATQATTIIFLSSFGRLIPQQGLRNMITDL